jgi:RNA polymerase sigma-70 factor (ECF subfamily)
MAVQGRHFSEAVIEKLAAERLEAQPLLDAQRKALDDCLTKLTESQRDLLHHRYECDQTIQDLAEQRRQPVATLYKTLHRTRKRLMDCVSTALKSEGWTT